VSQLLLGFGSAVLAAANLASAAAVTQGGRWRRASFAFSAAMQVPWTYYDVATQQWGFLALTVACIPVYARGWFRERRAEAASNGTSPARSTRTSAPSLADGPSSRDGLTPNRLPHPADLPSNCQPSPAQHTISRPTMPSYL
jgi:hypothetical protein